MATDFAMPGQQHTASPTQHNLYNSQQISPTNSATATPNNTSPTSPVSGVPAHLAANNRQLRPPKSPLYVPAVLRPTDPPKRTARQSPLTPPHSKDNSFDDSDPLRTLIRRSTGDSGKSGLGAIVETEWSMEGLNGFEKVKGLPNRDHWKPDSDSVVCDDTACQVNFGFLSRKHHCRRCGNIFCDSHSKHVIPLDQDSNYHPEGARVRACEHCYMDYLSWKISRSSRSNSESSHDQDTPSTPTVSCAGRVGRIGNVFGQKNTGAPESLGASVPRDWNWSTF
ncbi:related to VPS27-vacuolar protein sorting-associated protein [Rhynchosporium secalis]|uniref:Related to VPS27-vacuolar protein sorting-associated protein n=1 Tax=Rhynchosporium secalis TaxID=38038 RepID=A0A1E1MQQ8_RHYSE|nr:related to VPS27-vacuolar protein sorting-associated protein [Rhynchosporium secalis]